MYEIINILNQSKIVTSLEVLELVDESSIQAIKIKAELIDESYLFIREVISERGNKYSYHWQSKENKLLIRWDNVPHWKKIDTFPEHKHIGEKVVASERMFISEILQEIEEVLKKRD